MRYPRLRMHAALAMALASAAIQPAMAQAFPSKPVRMVVGFAPGGSTDKLARVLAQAMTETLGQSVIVDNRPGAAGNLAAELAATAAPDGYVIFMATLSSQSINPHLYSNLKFDPVKSFEPIMLVAKYPLLLMAAPQLPVNNVQDFITYTKANSDKLHFSSAGTGSPGHLAGEIYKSISGVEATHVLQGRRPGNAGRDVERGAIRLRNHPQRHRTGEGRQTEGLGRDLRRALCRGTRPSDDEGSRSQILFRYLLGGASCTGQDTEGRGRQADRGDPRRTAATCGAQSTR